MSNMDPRDLDDNDLAAHTTTAVFIYGHEPVTIHRTWGTTARPMIRIGLKNLRFDGNIDALIDRFEAVLAALRTAPRPVGLQVVSVADLQEEDRT